MEPKVSVVLPVYNVESYLEECLDSLLKQTLKEFELIAINDGSTDRSFSILKEYENKFINIKIINQKNKGLSATRNVGIENSTGEYLLFVDSDDMLKENALELLYSFSKSNSLDLTVYDALRVDEITGKVDSEFYSREKVFNKNILSDNEFMLAVIKKGMLHTPFHFYSRKFILENNLRFEEGLLHEDEIFSMTSYQHITKVGYIKDQLYIRRYRENSIMSANPYENMRSLNSYLYILDEFNKLIDNNQEKKAFIKLVKSRASLIMCNLIRYKDFNLTKLLKLQKKVRYSLNWPRIAYNLMKYKL